MRKVRVTDVMTRDVVTVGPETGFREIADLLVGRRSTVQIVSNVVRATAGVVNVVSTMTYDFDDTERRRNAGVPYVA